MLGYDLLSIAFIPVFILVNDAFFPVFFAYARQTRCVAARDPFFYRVATGRRIFVADGFFRSCARNEQCPSVRVFRTRIAHYVSVGFIHLLRHATYLRSFASLHAVTLPRFCGVCQLCHIIYDTKFMRALRRSVRRRAFLLRPCNGRAPCPCILCRIPARSFLR